MNAMLRLLAAILGAHIGRDEPAAAVHPDLAHKGNPAPDNIDRIAAEMTRPPTVRYEAASGQLSLGQIEETWRRAGAALGLPPTIRPCWACGDPAGFHVFHLPCCKVAPFRPASSPWERYP